MLYIDRRKFHKHFTSIAYSRPSLGGGLYGHNVAIEIDVSIWFYCAVLIIKHLAHFRRLIVYSIGWVRHTKSIGGEGQTLKVRFYCITLSITASSF